MKDSALIIHAGESSPRNNDEVVEKKKKRVSLEKAEVVPVSFYRSLLNKFLDPILFPLRYLSVNCTDKHCNKNNVSLHLV